ncbi:MAG: hypothetical protein M1833_001521 [Piccolia ochrophora]|nr:MAG: hypothetical protein M1833_001521 [Piccolia ochrophora]
MALTSACNISDLENERQRLEHSINRLKKSLQQWQTWEAEYEGLKEEILARQDSGEEVDLVSICRDFGGTLIDEKETKDLLGPRRDSRRTPKQVVDLLTRRIDYVQQNVLTVKKQLSAAEEQLDVLLATREPDLNKGDKGLPVTEIHEDLDEDGNVLSSHTSTPGSAAPQLLSVLENAGVLERDAKTKPPIVEPFDQEDLRVTHSADEDISVKEQKSEEDSRRGPVDLPKHPPLKEESRTDSSAVVLDSQRTPERTSAQRETITHEQSAAQVDKKEVIAPEKLAPVIPADESPEDAALRREMLQYALSDTQSIVAEMNLERRGSQSSQYSDFDYDIDDEDGYSVDDDEASADEEDEHGRTKLRVLDDEYKKQMEALEKKLGATVIGNVGPNPPSDSRQSSPPDTNSPAQPNGPPTEQKKPSRKGVRFADDLDISSPPDVVLRQGQRATAAGAEPIADSVIERHSPSSTTSSTDAPPPRKVSRFKSSRSTQSPAPPNTTPLSASIIERAPSTPPPYNPTETSSLVDNDDDEDPTLQNQLLATEYHRLRSRLIQREGGFVQAAEREKDKEIVPLEEEDEGGNGKRKVSLFKAARVGGGLSRS